MGERPQLLEISLFGPPLLRLDGQELEGLRRKNRALVFYLAAETRPIPREALLTFFWPDTERSASQPILRTMVHDLRKTLGENFLANNHGLSLKADTCVDVLKFSAALDTSTAVNGKLKETLDLYKGDFLENFSLADTSQFDDWAAAERERYRLFAIRGYTLLARQQEASRDLQAALDSMRQALSFNPFQEDLQRDLMRLLFLNGDRTGVVHQYESLRKLLDEEMGMPPMPETRNLYDSIINERYTPTTNESFTFPANEAAVKPTPDSRETRPGTILPFFGRETELAGLKTEIGRGKLILVEGEAGIGKTRLISELVHSDVWQAEKTLLVQGAAYELEQGLPYLPIIDALRGLLASPEWKERAPRLAIPPVWLTELSRLLPELQGEFPQMEPPVQAGDEAHLREALLQFFEALTGL